MSDGSCSEIKRCERDTFTESQYGGPEVIHAAHQLPFPHEIALVLFQKV